MTNEEIYALTTEIFDGIAGLAARLTDIENELIYRHDMDERRRRFAGKRFDTRRVVEVLAPLRRSKGSTADRRYVTRTFSDFRKGKPEVTRGETLTKLVRSMGLDVLDVDRALKTAEVDR